MNIIWDAPPPPPNTGTSRNDPISWRDFADRLRVRPGIWAKLDTGSATVASVAAMRLRKQKGIEATSRGTFVHAVYRLHADLD